MERLTEWNGEQTRHAYYPRCFKEPCYGSGCKISEFLPGLRSEDGWRC